MIYFGGCSITQGSGFYNEKRDASIYPNIIAKQLTIPALNAAEGGSSNLKIFTAAAKAIMDQQAEIYIIQWSALHRHWLYPQPNQGFYIGSDVELPEYKQFVAQFQLLNHDYSNIMSVVDYTRLLTHMAQQSNAHVYFINGLLPWTEDLLTGAKESEYTQTLFKDVDDPAPFKEQLKNNLELVDWSLWANPWTSINEMAVDLGPLGHHPGSETHSKIANMIINLIDKSI
jgi:hypothetical protein